MFWSKNKKKSYTPANPFYYIKVGFKAVYMSWICFPDLRLQYKPFYAQLSINEIYPAHYSEMSIQVIVDIFNINTQEYISGFHHLY